MLIVCIYFPHYNIPETGCSKEEMVQAAGLKPRISQL